MTEVQACSTLALLLIAGAAVDAQDSDHQEVIRVQSGEQVEETLADARDAELLRCTLYRKRLTEAESKDLEAAALRRLERRKANLAQLQRQADAGARPRQDLNASMNEVDTAVKDYVLAVSRTALAGDGVVAMAALEYESLNAPLSRPMMERFDGGGSFTTRDLNRIMLAYEKQFKKPLPISALGETALHRALGYNHRDRVDVAIFPDAAEGLWLRGFLESNDIPYYAFRSFVPGRATAAHIHIGPPSSRLLKTD